MNKLLKKESYLSLNYFLIVALIFNIGMIIFYMFYTFENYFHSDAATKMLLAKEILETGEFFPKEWYYANNDIWVFLSHGLLIPLIELFGLNYRTYGINSLIYLIIYLISAWYFINSFKINITSKLLFLNISLLTLSYFYGTFVFGEIAYITSIVFVFLSVAYIIRLIEYDDKKYLIYLFVLIFIFTIHNPQRSLIYYFLPIMASLGYISFISSTKRNTIIKALIYCFGSFIVATIAYYFILQEVQIIKGANNLLFADYDRVLSHINIFAYGLLNTFGLISQHQFSPFGLDGLVRILNFIFFGLVIFMSFSYIRKNNFTQNTNSTLIVYLVVVFLPILFLYIFTLPLAQNETTFRYFYPTIVILYVLLVLYIDKLGSCFIKLALISFLSFFVLVSNYNNLVKPYGGSTNIHKNLSKYLAQNNLEYGFASYWHSYINNVFTEDKSKVYPIHIASFEPFRWLSSNRWFKMYDEYDKSFIVFTQDEFEKYSDGLFKRVTPKKVDTVDGFKIAIFDQNIAYELNRIYHANMSEGIHFKKEGLPSFVESSKGLSGYESTHRWSEGDMTEIVFKEKLPQSFHLKFSGTPFHSMIGQQIIIKLGNQEKAIELKNGYSEYDVIFDHVDSNSVVFEYVNAKSPYEMRLSGDKRKLAFAFNTMIVEEIQE